MVRSRSASSKVSRMGMPSELTMIKPFMPLWEWILFTMSSISDMLLQQTAECGGPYRRINGEKGHLGKATGIGTKQWAKMEVGISLGVATAKANRC